MKKLLIIDHPRHNWLEHFDGLQLESGEDIVVDQANIHKINLSATSRDGIKLELMPEEQPIANSQQSEYRKFVPDMVLIKKISRNILFGFMYSNIPAINSLESLYMNLERAIVFGGLIEINKRLGNDEFPLIDQYYYQDHYQMDKSPEFPIVTKIGSAHSGFGKMKIESRQRFQDFASVMALYKDYVTSEPFIPVEYDFRIQKIGTSYRGLKRISTNWKANTGSYMLEEIPVSDKHKKWVDECSELFGGMDILALDA
ncbi:MAG: hypothetical protein OEZ01_15365, partial [Candidatus Heimdallarchaeota archaeon]|nr:hypothetical protein [Candidatus Heimdallarchaeota archaeon]